MPVDPEIPVARNDLVRSFDRGLAVIEAMSRTEGPVTLAEVARLCDTTRATARRLLLTLAELGFVLFDGHGYALRPRIMELGDAFLAGLRLPQIAHRHLKDLAHTVQDTCSLTILDAYDVVYVDRVQASRLMTVNIDIATRFPAYATSTGRVLLGSLTDAELDGYISTLHAEPLTAMTTTSKPRIRREILHARSQGYSIADQELEIGLRSVAAAVLDKGGSVLAAVNVSTQVARTPLEYLRDEVLPHLLETTLAIGSEFSET